MSLDFELLISGLVVTALKSNDARPTTPTAVDLICPIDDMNMHGPRLAYFPLDVTPDIELEMLVDPLGERSGSISLDNKLLEFVVTGNTANEFTLNWGPEETKFPNGRQQSEWMNWVATLDELGFGNFTVPASGLPMNANGVSTASARVTLPYGELVSANMIRDAETDAIIVWQFPATGDTLEKALANDLLFRIRGIESIEVRSNGTRLLFSDSSADGVKPVRMCLSNDARLVPTDYGGAITLAHLQHFGDALAPLQADRFRSRTFEPPHISLNGQRTDDPICDGALYVYQG